MWGGLLTMFHPAFAFMDQRKSGLRFLRSGQDGDEYHRVPRGNAEPELVYAIARYGFSTTDQANIWHERTDASGEICYYENRGDKVEDWVRIAEKS